VRDLSSIYLSKLLYMMLIRGVYMIMQLSSRAWAFDAELEAEDEVAVARATAAPTSTTRFSAARDLSWLTGIFHVGHCVM
jgi:hypothetical protein